MDYNDASSFDYSFVISDWVAGNVTLQIGGDSAGNSSAHAGNGTKNGTIVGPGTTNERTDFIASSTFDGKIDTVVVTRQSGSDFPTTKGTMGKHWFYPSDQDEPVVYVRYYVRQLPGFVMGHEKVVHLPLSGGGSGPITNKFFGIGHLSVQISLSGGEDGWLHQNVSQLNMKVDGSWFYVEQRFKAETTGGTSDDGEYDIWIDDCGVSPDGCDGLPGTLRGCAGYAGCPRTAGVDWTANTATWWDHLWLENWSNAGSDGEQQYDNIVVSKIRIGPLPATASSEPKASVGIFYAQ
jgi:hypothetical protein